MTAANNEGFSGLYSMKLFFSGGMNLWWVEKSAGRIFTGEGMSKFLAGGGELHLLSPSRESLEFCLDSI